MYPYPVYEVIIPSNFHYTSENESIITFISPPENPHFLLNGSNLRRVLIIENRNLAIIPGSILYRFSFGLDYSARKICRKDD